jgi:hypothetical protein
MSGMQPRFPGTLAPGNDDHRGVTIAKATGEDMLSWWNESNGQGLAGLSPAWMRKAAVP